MISLGEIQTTIVGVILEQGKLSGPIPPEKDLYSELGVESVDSIGILLTLEDKFGVAIDDTRFVKARTLNELTQLVSETLQ